MDDQNQRDQSKKSTKTLRSPPQDTSEKLGCGLCVRDQNFDDLVQCDKCDLWFHYVCVGVDSSVMNRDWLCMQCEENQKANTNEPSQETKNTDIPSQQKEPLIQLASNANESETVIGDQSTVDSQLGAFSNLFNQTVLPSLTLNDDVLLSRVRTNFNAHQTDSTKISRSAHQGSSTVSKVTVKPSRKSTRGSSSGKSSSVSSKANSVIDLTLRMLEEERELKTIRDKEYLRQKYSFLRDVEDETSGEEGMYHDDLVSNWVKNQSKVMVKPRQFSSTTRPVTKQQTSGDKNPEANNEFCSSTINPNATTGSQFPMSNPANVVNSSVSNDIGLEMSEISSVQVNTGTVNVNHPNNGLSYSSSEFQSQVSSNIKKSNLMSSSSNAQVFTSGNNPIGSTTDVTTNPRMSSYVSGGVLNWNSQARLNPMAMPYVGGGLISLGGIRNPTSQSQVGDLSSSRTFVPVMQPQINPTNSNESIIASVQLPINAPTAFSGVFSTNSQKNATSGSSVPINNTNFPFVNNSGVPAFNSNVPFVNNSSVPAFNSNAPFVNNSGVPAFNSNVPFVNNSSVPAFNSNVPFVNSSSVPAFNSNVPFVNSSSVPAFNSNVPFVNSSSVPTFNSNVPFVNSSSVPAFNSNVPFVNSSSVPAFNSNVPFANSSSVPAFNSNVPFVNSIRERKVPVCGDIREMYHQVRIRKEDQYAQLFLWRNGDSKAPPETYVMEVMTFGATCSPSCAQYIKNLNASKFIDEYPRAVEAIVSNHYVDDLMDYVHTEEEAVKLLQDVKHIHKQGGFEIRGILSNSRKVLDAFGEDCKTSAKILDIESSTVTERVLGMFWDVKTDCFTYLLKHTKIDADVLSGKRRPTKRELLKTLMSIFDPLGLLAYFLVYLKIVMQETWINNLQWDEPLTDELYEKWCYWLKFLPQVENIKIPRLYSQLLSPKDPDSVELHTFVDASENAYTAVSFLRIISASEIDVALVGAKTKVAPKQKLSIPKLELLSGVLGPRLAQSIAKGLTIKIDKRYFHSDSQTVLGWIKCNHRKLRQFVAFRIGEILDLTKESECRYVPGKENVADDATKWTKEPNFNQDSRWFQGPAFLREKESHWPKQIQNLNETEDMRHEFKLHLAHMPVDPPTLIEPERFSKWERMLRAQAYVHRSIKVWSSKVRKESLSLPTEEPLTHEELVRAEKLLYSLAQFDHFAEEIAILQCGDQSKAKIEITSSLYKCSPYLDEFGVLRMRGRIDVAEEVSFDTKRPIILPTKHRITRLIVDSHHRRLFHCHQETIVNEMMQKFYVPGIRSIVKKVIEDCQKCKNRRVKPLAPEMANLPVARLSHHQRGFSFVGIDYFGPMYVTHRRQREKRWGVIFTCLTMRAIHIEVASTLDTQSCIWCIRNFQAIRGTPLEYYSDNGTNLKAADKELKAELEKVDQNALCTRFSIHSKWNFNPPSSPHMSGSWEKMISSVKKCLKQAINIINSRPLTFVPVDSVEQAAITPNHLLVGSSSGSKNGKDNWDASSSVLYPSGDYKEDAKIIGRNWRISQQQANYFWKRWVQTYLPMLTRRTRWFDKVKPIEIGDVVVIVDEKNSRNTWPKGIVIDTPKIDKNGQVRSATVKVVEAVGPPKLNKDGKVDVKTTESVYVRPVHKLAILDINRKEEEVAVKEI